MNFAKIIQITPNFLDSEESREVAQKVRSFQKHWTPFGSDPKHPYMYYFGAANYLSKSVANYETHRDFCNPLLEKTFSTIYEKLMTHFSAGLNCDVIRPTDLAWPGFHIYHGFTMPKGGRIHWDLYQHRWVQQHHCQEVDLDTGLSFTLPIELTEGSGLFLWDLRYVQGHDGKSNPEMKEMLGDADMKFVSYEVGSLYTFRSDYLHQVAPNNRPVTAKRRITLQGHLLKRNDGKYLMFW